MNSNGRVNMKFHIAYNVGCVTTSYAYVHYRESQGQMCRTLWRYSRCIGRIPNKKRTEGCVTIESEKPRINIDLLAWLSISLCSTPYRLQTHLVFCLRFSSGSYREGTGVVKVLVGNQHWVILFGHTFSLTFQSGSIKINRNPRQIFKICPDINSEACETR